MARRDTGRLGFDLPRNGPVRFFVEKLAKFRLRCPVRPVPQVFWPGVAEPMSPYRWDGSAGGGGSVNRGGTDGGVRLAR